MMGETMSRLTVNGIRDFLASRASMDADSTVRDLTQMIGAGVPEEKPEKPEEPAKPEKPKKGILRSSRKSV
jgi:hypothetical protein